MKLGRKNILKQGSFTIETEVDEAHLYHWQMCVCGVGLCTGDEAESGISYENEWNECL